AVKSSKLEYEFWSHAREEISDVNFPITELSLRKAFRQRRRADAAPIGRVDGRKHKQVDARGVCGGERFRFMGGCNGHENNSRRRWRGTFKRPAWLPSRCVRQPAPAERAPSGGDSQRSAARILCFSGAGYALSLFPSLAGARGWSAGRRQ